MADSELEGGGGVSVGDEMQEDPASQQSRILSSQPDSEYSALASGRHSHEDRGTPARDAVSSHRPRRPQTSLDERKHIHRYAKHELVYFSQYRSTPKIGFSRAERDICKPAPKREPPKPGQQRYYADSWKEEDVPRKPAVGGKFGKDPRTHFSQTRETYPQKSMETILYGRESPGPCSVEPHNMWRRTNEGRTGKVPNVFRGSTTFGTGPMCHQLNRSNEGPGPAGMAMPRRPKMGGGRFNRNRSLTDFDRKIRAAKDLPGPASHFIQTDLHVPGGRFNMSRPKSQIELEVFRTSAQLTMERELRAAKDIPSPADTSTSRPWGFTGMSRIAGSHPMPKGGRVMSQPTTIGRSTIIHGGQTLIRPLASEALASTPGPGYYSVDF